MLLNSNVHNRVKHFDILLARELSLIEHEYSQNLMTYQRLENSIRRDNKQSSNSNRTKISIPFNNIYNQRTESIDYHKVCSIGNNNNDNSNQKRRLSSSTSSNMSQNPIDDSDNDTSSSKSLRYRRYCTKNQRLPLMLKAAISNRQKRKSQNYHWMESYQQLKKPKDNANEPFRIFLGKSSNPSLPQPSPIQKQVRSFLETLPTYKGIQHGFDNFAPASLYSNRSPIIIR